MPHYIASFIHGHVSDMGAMEGMTVEVDAPSVTDAADILYTTANRGNEVPTGVKVIEELHGCSLLLDANGDAHAALRCDLFGWTPEG
jgi:hypothetical protein